MIEQDGSSKIMPIEVGKYPTIWTVIKFPRPGIYSGAPLSDKNPAMQVQTRSHSGEAEAFLKEFGLKSLNYSSTLKWGQFSLLLAKVAHSYAVGLFDFDAIEYFLPPVIRGESEYLSHYVGGVRYHHEQLIPPADIVHGIRWLRNEAFVYVRTTFFGDRFPTYEVVVGKFKHDLALIRAKMACAEARISSLSKS